MQLIWLIVFWVFYYALHSILLVVSVKNKISKLFPSYKRAYRLGYFTFSLIGFLLIIWYYKQIPKHYLIEQSTILQLIGAIITFFGLLICTKALRGYNLREFVGIEVVEQNTAQNQLKTDRLNKYMRHPLYTGTLILLLGLCFISPTQEMLATYVVSIIYLIIGTRLEEKKLSAIFGKDYEEYKKQVPMFIPRIKK